MSLSGVGQAAAPRQSELADIRDRIQNMLGHSQVAIENVDSCLSRVLGANPPAMQQGVGGKPEAVPNGLIEEIKIVLSVLEQRVSTVRDLSAGLVRIG